MSRPESAFCVCLVLCGCGRIGFGPTDSTDFGPAMDSGPEVGVGDGAMDGRVLDGAGDAVVDTSPDGATLDPDLVVWLPLDGDPAIDLVGDAMGVITNPRCDPGRCPTAAPGVVGGAYEFDGIDDYLLFDTSSVLDFGASMQPFSVSVWYRTRNRGPAQQVVYAQATDAGDVAFQLSFEDLDAAGTYDVVWKLCAVSCPDEQSAQWVDGVEVDVWRFAVGVWNGTESILYIDGVERARMESLGVKFDGSPFMLGADWETGGSIEDSFDGFIDDLRIYRRALTVSEQMTIMGGA